MKPWVLSRRVCRFGSFEANLSGGLLTRNGTRVKMQDQPFRILAMLLERPGEIVTREELRQQLWPNGTYVDFDGSLNVALKKLRGALDDDPDKPRFVETVPKRGYRFIAPVIKEMAEKSAAHESTTGAAAPSEDRTRAEPRGILSQIGAWKFSRPTAVLFGILLVAVAGMVAYRWQGRGRPAGGTTAAAMKPIPARQAIAVLGFRNISGRAEDVWLATALSEMVSTELAAGGKLRLVSGEEVSNLRLSSPWSQTDTLGQPTTSHIGTALNSDLLVLGSYASVGKSASRQLRLDARLQDAKTGEILAEIAEIGNDQNLFQLVSRIGGRIRDRLGVPGLEQGDEPSVSASLPANREADRFYALGLAKLRDYDYATAKELFEQAIKADPKFPLAHSMLSRACLFLGFYDKGKAEAKQGLDLSGSLSRVQRMEIEANYYEASADRAKGADIYRALYALYPDSLDYGLQLAKLQLDSYRPEESLDTIRQLRRLPPPAREDPRLDLREAYIFYSRDSQRVDRLFHSAATKAAAQGKKLVYAKAQQMICQTNRQHLEAPPECQEAYEILLAAGNRAQAASCLQLMAEAQRLTGHNEESIPLYEQALRMFNEAGDREQTGVALVNLSLVFESAGKWDRAEESNRQAWQNFQAVNDRMNTGAAMANIADILVLRGHLREAADMYQQTWKLGESNGWKRNEYCHIRYSLLSLMRGELQQARREVEPQIASLREYGADPWQLGSALAVLGDIGSAEGDLVGARKSYQEALDVLKKANSPLAGARVSLAGLAMDEGHPEEAEMLLREAIAEFERDKSTGDEIDGYASLSRALLMRGKVVEARDAISHAFKLADLREFPVISLPLQILRARATAAATKPGTPRRGDIAAAQQELLAVIQKAKQLSLYKIGIEARLALGELEMQANPALGRSELEALAREAHDRGFELLSRKATQLLSSATNAASPSK